MPFNIASYALLTHMMAAQAGLDVGEFVWTGGDCHIYDNHVEQVRLQLSRDPRPYPELVLAPRDSIFDYTYEDIAIIELRPASGDQGPRRRMRTACGSEHRAMSVRPHLGAVDLGGHRPRQRHPVAVPEDQARFKELTLGHTVVMGRLTWESLPAKVRPLPGAQNCRSDQAS